MTCNRTLIALVCTALLLFALEALGTTTEGYNLEGSWEVTVKLENQTPVPFFETLETYDRGGGLITSNNLPFLTRVGQGAWEKLGNRQYLVKIKFYKFDANGLPSGTITVTHTVTMQDKNEYSGTGTALFCDLDGTTCQAVDFNTEGRRFTAAP